MTSKITIPYNGIYYTFTPRKMEDENMFLEKAWYVIKCQPKNKKEYDHALKKAQLYVNEKYYKCNYELTENYNK